MIIPSPGLCVRVRKRWDEDKKGREGGFIITETNLFTTFPLHPFLMSPANASQGFLTALTSEYFDDVDGAVKNG